MKQTYENFGQWVRHWREEKGLTQQQLADLIGKTKSYVSNIERNQPHAATGALPRPSIEVVDKLAKALSRSATEARDAAGYGLKGTRGAVVLPAMVTTGTAPTGVEEMLLYYFRSLPPARQPEALAVMARFYQETIASPDQRAIEEEEIGQTVQILGRLASG